MLKEDLIELINEIIKQKCEDQRIELKSAVNGCPKIYDTLSSFSNQSDGGIIIFGIDESKDYEIVGVYDAQDLIQKVSEQCKQMEPVLRVITTVCTIESKTIVAVEVPSREIYDRPVYYKGAGILRGSYSRVGDSDEPMTDYEVYSYEAYKKHKQDDIREATLESAKYLDKNMILYYLTKVRLNRPNTRNLSDEELLELLGVYKNGIPTISSVLCFSKIPQMFYPQLCITAVVVPGYVMGDCDENNNRFLDNKKIEGTIPEMLDGAIAFVIRNMKTSVSFKNGKREDITEYPITAIREAVLNALVHRDYSIHTEGMPIRLEMYKDRLEIVNTGGLYGSINIDDLGELRADTRNKNLIAILETIEQVENRYSGIPTIKKEMKEAGLKEPLFVSERGLFKVVFYNSVGQSELQNNIEQKICDFCKSAKTKGEIAEFLGKTQYYVVKTYIEPLVAKGKLSYTIPNKPKSKLQKIFTVK